MDNCNVINDRRQKLNELKTLLSEIDDKLLSLTKELNWDYSKLQEEKTSNMVTCSINPQHRVPFSKIQIHEKKCSLHHQGYSDNDKFFPEHSGRGSFINLTPETLQIITNNVPPYTGGRLRAVPETSANFDQNFNREEKLAIYNYVIANTQKQISYPDLWLEPAAKPEEKREMAAWEIAAAERDAKRRRASYRNKVHTNRKTHTEILREVIEAQMEAFKEETTNEKTYERPERHRTEYKKSSHELKETSGKHQSRCHQTSSWGNKEGRERRRSSDDGRHSKHRHRKRSPPDTGNDIKSGSRSHDKYRKWKTYEGRSHSHRSSHTHARK